MKRKSARKSHTKSTQRQRARSLYTRASQSQSAASYRLLRDATPGALRNLADTMRGERFGGILLALGAIAALTLVNSPLQGVYNAMSSYVPLSSAPSWLHLDLSLRQWALDGLLVIFFFVVGLELKREFVVGELQDPRRAMLPIFAAVGGMVAPAVIYVVVQKLHGSHEFGGWAIPTATDIAFAVAVLAVVGKWLPAPLRIFLLTLAVVDDLLGISIIAVFYTSQISLGHLLGAFCAIAVFGFVSSRGAGVLPRPLFRLVLVMLAVASWWLMHSSGVHATIAGVLLGLVVPATESETGHSTAEGFEHFWRPFSATFCVPVFALFAAGVAIDAASLSAAASDSAAQGVFLGLVIGKPLGIVAATWVVVRWTSTSLDERLNWADILGVGMLAAVGFTVSLFIGELAFSPGSPQIQTVKAAIVAASLTAVISSGILLSLRSRAHGNRSIA